MSRSETVWIVDDDRSIRWVLEKALQQEGMTTQSFDSADGVMGRLARQQPDVIISDIRMPGASGLDLLAQIREQHPRLPVIIMTAHSDLDSAVASYQGCLRIPAQAVRRGRGCLAGQTCQPACPGTTRAGCATEPGAHTRNHRRSTGHAGGVPRHRPPQPLQHHRIDQR